MKRMINTTVHGTGYFFVMAGFILFVGAAGLADNDGTIELIVRCTAAGAVSCLGGLFLTRWKL